MSRQRVITENGKVIASAITKFRDQGITPESFLTFIQTQITYGCAHNLKNFIFSKKPSYDINNQSPFEWALSAAVATVKNNSNAKNQKQLYNLIKNALAWESPKIQPLVMTSLSRIASPSDGLDCHAWYEQEKLYRNPVRKPTALQLPLPPHSRAEKHYHSDEKDSDSALKREMTAIGDSIIHDWVVSFPDNQFTLFPRPLAETRLPSPSSGITPSSDESSENEELRKFF